MSRGAGGPAGAAAALADRFGVPPGSRAKLQALADMLASDPGAATRIRDPGGVDRDHLADALVALELEPVRHCSLAADLGSGPGVPGIPLAIALPDSRWTLLESNARKVEFLRRALATCGVDNAVAVWARAEEWTEERGACDLVTARALAALPVVLEYAAPLLCVGGVVVAWRGRRQPAEERSAQIAAAELGLGPGAVIAVRPYPRANERHLHVYVKERPTPPRFPRRPGVASKRPLGV